MYPPIDRLTAQKYDQTFGVNVIGHYLFFRLLYPLLTSPSSSTQSQSSPSRVIWTSSSGNLTVNGRLNFSAFTDGPARRKAGTFNIYGQSKLAQIQLSTYVAKRAADAGDNVLSIAIDPGHIRTEIFRDKKSWYLILWVR